MSIGLSGSRHFEIEDHIMLPDGREVFAILKGHYEYDTNATVTEDPYIDWAETGIELTNEECNELVGEIHLHEYVTERLLEKRGDD